MAAEVKGKNRGPKSIYRFLMYFLKVSKVTHLVGYSGKTAFIKATVGIQRKNRTQ